MLHSQPFLKKEIMEATLELQVKKKTHGNSFMKTNCLIMMMITDDDADNDNRVELNDDL